MSLPLLQRVLKKRVVFLFYNFEILMRCERGRKKERRNEKRPVINTSRLSFKKKNVFSGAKFMLTHFS